MRLLHVAATLALLLAGMSASGHGPDGTGAQPRCIHDEVVARQLGGQTLAEALSRGRFRASAVVAGPEAGVARAAGDAAYQPIRIKVYTEDVFDPTKYCNATGERRFDFLDRNVYCSSDNILTAEKQKLLVDMMIPAAVQMHAERLSVHPLRRLYVRSSPSDEVCGSFRVPAAAQTVGVDSDFVLLVAAAPVLGSTVAWATSCGFAPNGRPVSGVINVKPQYIDGSDQSVRTMAHEIAHALGFSVDQFFRSKMIDNATDVRGKPSSLVVASPRVVQRAGNQFGCDKIVGMELDDTGGAGTAGSHWSLRNGLDDLMCGYVSPMMRYSAITIAAMEDTGFYKGNYDKAEGMPWGYQQGCALLDEKCMNNNITKFPSMFCNDPDAPLCSADRTEITGCPLFLYNKDLAPYFRYFTVPNLGGVKYVDYCPVAFSGGPFNCRELLQSTRDAPGPSTAPPRCVDIAPDSTLSVPVCADIECNSTAATYRVRFEGATDYVSCPEGSIVDASTSAPSMFTPGSNVVCPPVTSVCPFVFNSLALNVTLKQRTDGVAAGAGCGVAAVLAASVLALLVGG